MEGARWDIQSGIIVESRLKELFPPMPVINVRVSFLFLFKFLLNLVLHHNANGSADVCTLC